MTDHSELERDLGAQIAAASDLEALDQIRVAALGKTGVVSGLLKSLGQMSPEMRRTQGPAINGLRDRVAGCYAPDKRARVNPGWLPSGRNAPGDAIRLGTAACGQRNVGESAKSFRFDAFDVSVADQENFGHDAIPPWTPS